MIKRMGVYSSGDSHTSLFRWMYWSDFARRPTLRCVRPLIRTAALFPCSRGSRLRLCLKLALFRFSRRCFRYHSNFFFFASQVILGYQPTISSLSQTARVDTRWTLCDSLRSNGWADRWYAWWWWWWRFTNIYNYTYTDIIFAPAIILVLLYTAICPYFPSL